MFEIGWDVSGETLDNETIDTKLFSWLTDFKLIVYGVNESQIKISINATVYDVAIVVVAVIYIFFISFSIVLLLLLWVFCFFFFLLSSVPLSRDRVLNTIYMYMIAHYGPNGCWFVIFINSMSAHGYQFFPLFVLSIKVQRYLVVIELKMYKVYSS